MIEREQFILRLVRRFSPRARRALLHAVMLPPPQRSVAIEELQAEPGGAEMAELLIDLEQNRLVAAEVADALRTSLK